MKSVSAEWRRPNFCPIPQASNTAGSSNHVWTCLDRLAAPEILFFLSLSIILFSQGPVAGLLPFANRPLTSFLLLVVAILFSVPRFFAFLIVDPSRIGRISKLQCIYTPTGCSELSRTTERISRLLEFFT